MFQIISATPIKKSKNLINYPLQPHSITEHFTAKYNKKNINNIIQPHHSPHTYWTKKNCDVIWVHIYGIRLLSCYIKESRGGCSSAPSGNHAKGAPPRRSPSRDGIIGLKPHQQCSIFRNIEAVRASNLYAMGRPPAAATIRKSAAGDSTSPRPLWHDAAG